MGAAVRTGSPVGLPGNSHFMKIDFTPPERALVDEQFTAYMQVVTIIARLHGIRGTDLSTVQLAPDRSGLIVTEPDNGGVL
jgi:hypothetical protein